MATPNIDALAAQGTVLDRYYTTPLCSPTRASLMTGLYTHRTGTQANVIYWDTPWAPSANLSFLPQHLKAKAGYGATALFGKWHLGMYTADAFPTSRGFDTFSGFMQGGGSHGTHVAACTAPAPDPVQDTAYVCPGPRSPTVKDYRGYDWFSGTAPDWTANGTSSTDLIAQAAVDFVHAHAHDPQPFFLYLAFQNVHEPLGCSQAAYARFQHVTSPVQRLLFAYLWDLDAAVGRVVGALAAARVPPDRTLLVFASDNGAPPEVGAGGRNWPLAGFKSQVWEGGVRVPALVVAPGRVPANRTTSLFVHVTDWVPTLLRAAGVPTTQLPVPLDGLDMWQRLTRPSPVPAPFLREIVLNVNPLCWAGQFGPPKAAFLHGHMKLLCFCYQVAGLDGQTSTGCTGPTWLFNVTADPSETHNLAQQAPDIVALLQSRLAALVVPSVPPMQVMCVYVLLDTLQFFFVRCFPIPLHA